MVSTVGEDNFNSAPVQASTIDMQLRCAVTELNPNYDFITAKYPEQQLREIPRNKLKLIRSVLTFSFFYEISDLRNEEHY